MSEAIRCDQCGKTMALYKARDWWHIERASCDMRISGTSSVEEGGDFCSDVCACNFFVDKQYGKPEGKK